MDIHALARARERTRIRYVRAKEDRAAVFVMSRFNQREALFVSRLRCFSFFSFFFLRAIRAAIHERRPPLLNLRDERA